MSYNYNTADWCSVPGCPCLEHEVYHHFPEDETLQDTWLQLIKPPKQKRPVALGRSPRVCSLHFDAELDYDINDAPEGELKEQPLKSPAVPSIFPWSEKWIYNKKNGKSSSTKNHEKKVIKIERELVYCCQFCIFSSAFKRSWVQHQKKHSVRLEREGSLTDDDDAQGEHPTKRPIRKVVHVKELRSHSNSYSSIESSALKGGKLNMHPIVLLERLSREALQ